MGGRRKKQTVGYRYRIGMHLVLCQGPVVGKEQQFVLVSGTVTLAEPVRVQWLLASLAKSEAVQWEQLLSRSDHYQWMQGGEAVYASLSLRPSGGWRAE